MRSSKPILLVEDDRVDAMTVRRALTELDATNQLIHKTDGVQAMEHLRDKSNELPCLILMDLNTPKMSGMEFLQIIKADETLKNIPIVAMSTSCQQQDVDRTLQLGVVRYIVKSIDYEEFVEALSAIGRFWRATDELLTATQDCETPGPPMPY